MIVTNKITQDEMRNVALSWISEDENYIVEVGCANGNFSKVLYEKGIMNYLGIDIVSHKIKQAEKSNPKMKFVCCDILENLNLLTQASMVISFQCLEHIYHDLKIIKSINKGVKVILSVPNSPYRSPKNGGHIRWFELNGWKNRYEPYINFDQNLVIQNPKKQNKRSFLFRGVRNGNT